MKTSIILVHIILLLTTSQAVFCQNECICIGTEKINTEPYLSGELFTPDVPLNIMTYFNRNWLPGDIYLADGGIIKNKKIRYNGLVDELFCLDPETNQTIKLDKEAIAQFHFHNFQGDTSVYFRKLKVKRNLLPDSTEIFVQVIYQGNVSLFVFRTFYFNHRETVYTDKSYILKDIYTEDPVYYMKLLNNEIVEFKRFSRKSIYTLVPGKKIQIKKFFRESISGRIKTNQEIIGLTKFLSSIVDP
jgi:hypothetical protein